jgi:acyl-CoA synthetase (AMP-forming)/AMP-acid ligase II
MMLPLFHANAQVVTCVIPMMIGCEVVMWERFSASKFWQTVEEFEPVTISAVPTILAAVLNAEGAPSGATSLRYVICGAAPLSVELLEAFQNRFDIRILEGYGLTETTCVSSINPYYAERKAGSIGLPIRGQEIRIVDGEGNALPNGEYGEIVIKGPNVMQGYLKNPEATAESIRDGWLYTGDVGYADEDGYLYIVDRSKDMIIRGGENIYPREIEEVLHALPGVAEAQVVGVPSARYGEEVMAWVKPREGAALTEAGLVAACRERIARYKVPRFWKLVEQFPMTVTGKVQKYRLRELAIAELEH